MPKILEGLKPWQFRWKGESYIAWGKWEKNWIKWAMKHNPKALDTFIKNELKAMVAWKEEIKREVPGMQGKQEDPPAAGVRRATGHR